jgi:ferredoxin
VNRRADGLQYGNKESAMKAVVEDTCIGCGLCPQICPEVFEMNDEGKAIVKVSVVPLDAEETCREAATSCPVEAINITE